MPPFIVYSLGRSRTAWLSAFLTYGDWKCYHEISPRLRSFKDIKDLFEVPNIGILESAAVPARPLIKYARPDIREVVILRPLEDAYQSYLKIPGVQWDEIKLRKILQRNERELKKISQETNILTIDFSELNTEEGCKKIFEFCLPYEFERAWWLLGKDQNIQVDPVQFLSYWKENREKIEQFKKQLKQDLRRLYKMNAIAKKGGFECLQQQQPPRQEDQQACHQQ